jgi:hypothetical protein
LTLTVDTCREKYTEWEDYNNNKISSFEARDKELNLSLKNLDNQEILSDFNLKNKGKNPRRFKNIANAGYEKV